ncbi:MAG: lysophospholipase [Gammaproteobacteria bacterium]|nr:lysophospholipase [Gammaproteobacteria bacterium]
MKILLSLVGILLVCYCAAAAYLSLNQRSFIYFPSRAVEHPHPVRTFESGGETIEVVELNSGQQQAIIYFGGNAENVVFNAPEFLELFPAHTVYLVNYRGYGGSSGQPTEKSLYRDAETIFDAVNPDHAQLSVIGKSLGSGVASWLASVRNIDRLVLVTPYDSIARLAAARYWMFPVEWLLQDKFDSISRAGEITAPSLIIVAEHDRIIPPSHSMELAAAFPPAQIEVVTIKNTNHNSVTHDPAYHAALGGFFNP